MTRHDRNIHIHIHSFSEVYLNKTRTGGCKKGLQWGKNTPANYLTCYTVWRITVIRCSIVELILSQCHLDLFLAIITVLRVLAVSESQEDDESSHNSSFIFCIFTDIYVNWCLAGEMCLFQIREMCRVCDTIW